MSSASTSQPGTEGWKMADMDHITARPFIESVVMPHPVVVDPDTKRPLVPVIPSTLSPQKPGELAEAATVGAELHKRLTVTATPFYQSVVHPHPVVVDEERHTFVPIVPSSLTPEKQDLPKSEEIVARAQTARLVAAKRSLELGDGPQSVAVATKDAEAYWAGMEAKAAAAPTQPAEETPDQTPDVVKCPIDAMKGPMSKDKATADQAKAPEDADAIKAPIDQAKAPADQVKVVEKTTADSGIKPEQLIWAGGWLAGREAGDAEQAGSQAP